jgi:hypothetical protein
LCLLAYHLEWQMGQALAAAQARRRSPVAKAPSHRPRNARPPASAEDGHPVHSFRTLFPDLATMTQNTVRFGAQLDATVLATPTALQKHAFDLLGLSPTAEL